jgi:hypothetical protein
MKFTLPIAILAVAVSVDAAAVADQDKRYCHAEGQACDTVKRAADAFSDAISQNTNLVTRDETNGETSLIAARQLHELALAIAASHSDPAAFYAALGAHGGSPTTGDTPTEKRDAEPGWCTQFLGQPCWKRDTTPATPVKREAEAGAEPDRFCTRFMGSSCWKRDGNAAAADEVKRCTSEGQACWKAKRAAAAVINAIDQGNSMKMSRDADKRWCTQFLGMPCWKRAATCNGPAGVCTKATRDLHAMYNAARTIIEA